jgi:hypothetical protein
MKTGEVVRYALILILIALLISVLPFLWAVFWYALPFILLVFVVFQLVIFFNKDWILSPGQPYGEEGATADTYDDAHSRESRFEQFRYFMKEKRVMNNLWKIFFTALTIVTVVTALAYFIGRNYWQGRNTRTELNQISQALDQHKNEFKAYPENLGVLIGNNPLKRDWRTDDWGNRYTYEVAPDKQEFSLISPGKDGELRTKDDIIVK